MLGGLSAVVLDFETGSPVARLVPSHSARLLITGLLFAGCGSLITISPIGRRSGAHLNPAVTLGFWCRRHLHPFDLAGYVLSQLAGGLLGAELLRLVWGWRVESVGYGVTHPGAGVTPLAAAGIEALMTAILVLSIFLLVSSARTARFTPLVLWPLIAVLVWRGAPFTGTSLNPARSLGPAVVAGVWTDFWVYVAGPLSGSLLAVVLMAIIPRRTLTAKLFHDPRFPTVMGSDLPQRRG